MRKWQKFKYGQNWAIVGQNAPTFCAPAEGWPFKPLHTLGLYSTLVCNVQLHSLLRVSQGPWSCLQVIGREKDDEIVKNKLSSA